MPRTEGVHLSAWVSDVQWEFCSKSQLQFLLSSCQFSLKQILESPLAELPAIFIVSNFPLIIPFLGYGSSSNARPPRELN